MLKSYSKYMLRMGFRMWQLAYLSPSSVSVSDKDLTSIWGIFDLFFHSIGFPNKSWWRELNFLFCCCCCCHDEKMFRYHQITVSFVWNTEELLTYIWRVWLPDRKLIPAKTWMSSIIPLDDRLQNKFRPFLVITF